MSGAEVAQKGWWGMGSWYVQYDLSSNLVMVTVSIQIQDSIRKEQFCFAWIIWNSWFKNKRIFLVEAHMLHLVTIMSASFSLTSIPYCALKSSQITATGLEVTL